MMARNAHQSLLLWVVRKMTADGFMPCACDGTIAQETLWNKLSSPPNIMGIRPDACGIDPNTGTFAFGEAKTYHDIDNLHTRQQLRVLGYLIDRHSGKLCPIYFAVPRSAASVLDRVLRNVGLLGKSHLVRLHIPDCFVESRPNAA